MQSPFHVNCSDGCEVFLYQCQNNCHGFERYVLLLSNSLRTHYNKTGVEFFAGRNLPATVVVRVGNNRPDLGTNPICNRFTGQLEEGKPLFLPCNPPMPGAFVSVHLEGASLSQLSICEAFVYTDQVIISNSGYCLEHIRHSCVDYALFAAMLSCVSTHTYILAHAHAHTSVNCAMFTTISISLDNLFFMLEHHYTLNMSQLTTKLKRQP